MSESGKNKRSARIISVTSGKGGVGKTNISVNLAIALAYLGRRVILLDLDLGLADVDILLNLSVKADLGDVLRGEATMESIVTMAQGKIMVVPGAFGDESLANLGSKERMKLIDTIEHMTQYADYLLIDTGAGLAKNIIDFTCTADDVLVVTTPEPTAMLDAYAVIKAVHNAAPETMIHLLMNMARDRREAQQAQLRMASIAQHFLSSRLAMEAYLLYDNVVGDAVRHRQPFFLRSPRSQPAQALMEVARTLESTPVEHTDHRKRSFIDRMVERFTAAQKTEVAEYRAPES